MYSSLCNNKGLSMIEVLIALFLTMIGVMALISMQPQGWLLAGKSDHLGRAAEILHRELETIEAHIINPCNTGLPWAAGTPLPSVLNTSNTTTVIVFASGGAAHAGAGDAQFSVQRTITNSGANLWTIAVQVTWPGNAVGIRESIIATRQGIFCFPNGCNASCP